MKKMAERNWYLAAQFWGDHGDTYFYSHALKAESIVRADVQDLDVQYPDYEDRVCLYSQYCLERAGIPAGTR